MRRIQGTPIRRRVAAGSVGLLVVFGLLGEAKGHGVRVPFSQWGGFTAGAVQCQRIIARSVAQCAANVWAQQRVCARAVLVGQTCDQTVLNATFEAIKVKALNTIDSNCTDHQASELQYLGLFDLHLDVDNFCGAAPLGAWPTAAVSGVYGPVEALGTPTAAQLACSDAAADAVDSVMQFAFRKRRQCMDHIAAQSLSAPNRSAVLDSAGRSINAAYTALAARLAARCSPAEFMALYGRTPDAFVAGLGARADCIGGQFYIQDMVLCPAAVCGNGIVEPGESCDDGNITNGDACPSSCTVP